MLLLSFQNSFAQRNEFKAKDETYPTKIFIQPRFGLSYQSTLFKPVFDFSSQNELSNVYYPIKFEEGTQGFGINFGADFLINLGERNNIGLRPDIRYRYDYFYGLEIWPGYNEIVKSSMFDIGLYFLFNHKMKNGKEWSINIGYTFNQIGKKKEFDLSSSGLRVPGYPDVLVNFQYASLNYGFEYGFLKLNKDFLLSGSIVLNYIPHGHPAYPWRDFMTLGFGITLKYEPDCLVFNLRN